MLPNTFILGAAKSGTTTLAKWLMQHEHVYVPEEKELHYLNNEKRYHLGKSFYETFYENKQRSILVDATPAYFHAPEIVIPHIKELYEQDDLARLKFIIVLRDPAERAFSHYKHRCRLLKEKREFKETIDDQTHYSEWKNYVRDGFYSRQLDAWLQVFSKEQFLILLTEDLKADPGKAMADIENFLNIPVGDINFNLSANVASKPKNKALMQFLTRPNIFKSIIKRLISERLRKPVIEKLIRLNLKPDTEKDSMRNEDRERLVDLYFNDIVELEGTLGRDLSKWKKT
ncbi:sulfotransferase family protein [Neptuniibacter sp. PT34_22]|uniref:sulfotransferase family protein n=1 Tax=Neptuniibacter sp. PT34_22 TaxID=3398205 RepID=UPI0039F4E404